MRTQPFCLRHVALGKGYFLTGLKGRFDVEICHRSNVCLVFRPVFRRPCIELLGNVQDARRRRLRSNRGRKPFLGGSDPTLDGFQPPNARGAGGRYRPSCSGDFIAPSPAEESTDNPTALNPKYQRR
jgi:hypothetical protein